jgi:hypothetical protein
MVVVVYVPTGPARYLVAVEREEETKTRHDTKK